MNLESIKETVWAFMAGKEFMIAVGAIVVYMIFTGVLRRVFGALFGWISSILSIFTAFRWRRAAFNFISLVFMVGGVACGMSAKAQLEGGNGVLEAIVGGGFALAVWAIIMMISNQFSRPAPKRKKPKVTLPSSWKK